MNVIPTVCVECTERLNCKKMTELERDELCFYRQSGNLKEFKYEKLIPVITRNMGYNPFMVSYYDNEKHINDLSYFDTLKKAELYFTYMFEKGNHNIRLYKCLQGVEFEHKPDYIKELEKNENG